MAGQGGFFGRFSASKGSDEETRRQATQSSSSEKVMDILFKIIFSLAMAVILLSMTRRIFINYDILVDFLTKCKLGSASKYDTFSLNNLLLMGAWVVDLIFLIVLIALSGKQSKTTLIILTIISIAFGCINIGFQWFSIGDMIDNVATAGFMISIGIIIFVELFVGEHE